MKLKVVKQSVAIFQHKIWQLVAGILLLFGITGYAAGFIPVSISADKSIRRAQRSLAIGQPSEARRQLKWLIWFEPDHAAANFLIGQSFLDLKEYGSAIPHFKVIEPTQPEFKASRQKLAGCFLNDNQLEKAEIVLSRILQSFPGSLPVRRELAVMFLGQMRADEAVQVLLASIKQEQELTTEERMVILRDLLVAQFAPPTAEDCKDSLLAAHAQHPGQTTVIAALSECFLALGREFDAEPLINQLISIPEHELTAAVLKLRFLISLARYADARELSSSVEEKIAGPVDDFTRVHWQFYILKSTLQEHFDDDEAAVQSLERAKLIDALDRRSAIRYARLLQRAGKTDISSKLFAAVHRRAEAEMALWHLTGKVRKRTPSRDECMIISQHFTTLDESHQASEWRRMANEVVSRPRNSTNVGFGISQ